MLKSLKHWVQRNITSQVKPIKISGIFSVYYRIGCPEYDDIGTHMIQAKMTISGRTAVYLLTSRESTSGDCDWYWWVYTFHHYKEKGEQDYPVYG